MSYALGFIVLVLVSITVSHFALWHLARDCIAAFWLSPRPVRREYFAFQAERMKVRTSDVS